MIGARNMLPACLFGLCTVTDLASSNLKMYIECDERTNQSFRRASNK